MVCECQSTTDPVIQSIWESLQNYDYKNARFIAERVFAENPNEETLYLLATCIYRNNLPKQAKFLLLRHENNSPKCKYLLAKCHMDTGNINEAECVLIGSNQELSTVIEVQKFYKDLTPYILLILGDIFIRTDRRKMSVACYKKCLELNPFLWSAYEDLINMSENIDPNEVFVFPTESRITNTSCLKVVSNRLNIGDLNRSNFPLKKKNDLHDSQEDLSVSRENVNPKYDAKYLDTMDMDDDRLNCNNAYRNTWNSLTLEPSDNDSGLSCNISKSVVNTADVSVKMPLFGNVQLPNTVSFGNFAAFTMHDPDSQDKRTAISSILSQNTANSGKKVRNSTNTNKKFPISNFRCTDTSTPISTIRSSERPGVILFSTPSSSVLNKQSSPHTAKDTFSNHPQNHHLVTIATATATSPITTTNHHYKPVTTSSNLIYHQQPTYEFSPIISTVITNNLANSSPIQQRALSTLSPSPNSIASISSSSSGTLGPRTRSQVAKAAAAHQKMLLNNGPNTKPALTKNSQSSKTEKSHMSHKSINTDTNSSTLFSAKNTNDTPAITAASSSEYSGVNSASNYLSLLQALAVSYRLLKLNKFTEAINSLRSLPKHHLDTALVSNWLARAHFELTDSTKAYEVLFNSRKMEPWQLHGVVLYSSVLWKMNRETLLLNLSNEMLEFDRECAEIWCVYGNCMSLHRDSDAAIRFLQRAIQINPKLTIAYILLGHEFYLEDEIDKALLCFRRVQELDKTDHKPLYGISMIYQRQEKYSEACRLMKEALRLYPDSLYLLTNLAVIYTKLHQQYDEPIQKVRGIFTAHTSGSSENCLKLALDLIERACQLYNKEPICIYHKSTILYQMGLFNEALEGLKQLSSVNPKESRVLMLISLIYKQLDKPTLSMMYSSRATELDPKCNNESLLLDRSVAANMIHNSHSASSTGDNIEVARGSAINTSASSTSSVVVMERSIQGDEQALSSATPITSGNHVSLDFLESD